MAISIVHDFLAFVNILRRMRLTPRVLRNQCTAAMSSWGRAESATEPPSQAIVTL